MVTVILNGGMGNQMFQYATGKALSIKHGAPLKLDTSFLQTRIPFKKYTPLKGFTYRDYELDLFDVPETARGLFGNSLVDKYFSYALLKAYNLTLNKNNSISDWDNCYLFKEEIFDMGNKVVLDGSWNNYKYFKDYENEIKEIFDMDKLYDEQFEAFEQQLKNTPNSVALHLRRGDYLNEKHKNVYIGLNEIYYRNAVKYMRENLENPHFFMFTQDDPEWFEENLNLEKGSYTIVPQEVSGYRNRTHFRLMSLTNHNIIANSTYSWWSAYLNKNPNKIVISPNKWMTMNEFENIPTWVSLDVE